MALPFMQHAVSVAQERRRLESLAHRSHSAPQVARRARIILACADGRATTSVAKRLHLSATTVCKWRTRFILIVNAYPPGRRST